MLNNFTEEQVVKAVKPLLVHNNWEYLEEYFRRERDKAIALGMKQTDSATIYRAQGAHEVLTKLISLKPRLMGAS